MNKSILKKRRGTNGISLIEENKESISLVTKLCLAIIFVSSALVGIAPKGLLGLVILCACLPLITTKEIYLVYPVMLFYNLQFGELFGISIYSYFSLIFLFFSLVYENNIKVKKSFLAPFVLFVLYCVIVILPVNISKSLFAIINMLCIMILITQYLSNTANLRKFFKIYALIAPVAFFTGTQIESKFKVDVLIGNQVIESVRNCATFEDPNYMGFFYTVAIFSIITLKLFTPKIRAFWVIALYVMVFSTLSITAIVVNALVWIFYLFVSKKINLKILVIIVLIIGILLGLYSYGKSHPEAPIIGMLSNRLSEKLEGMDVKDSNNLGNLTTGRSDLAKVHFDYFMNLPVWKMFVGMNAASAIYTNLDGFRSVAHNEYIDWLLNVGLIGFIILLFFLFRRMFTVFLEYKKTQSADSLCILTTKFVWILYAFTLTLYGDFRFLFVFLL